MWAPDRSAGYVARRQAHEALIHRLDAEHTGGQVTALDADLASDGALEALTYMYDGCPPWGTFTQSATQVAVVLRHQARRTTRRTSRSAPPTGGCRHRRLSSAGRRISTPGCGTDAPPEQLTVTGDREVFTRLEQVLAQPIG